MTTDMNAALHFYQEVFGWQAGQSMDMGSMGKYQIFNRPHGQIGGMMNKPTEMANVPPNWQIYFHIPDVDAAVERVKVAGGKILNGPMDVPDGDRVLNAMDPQGAAFGLHSEKTKQFLVRRPVEKLHSSQPRLGRIPCQELAQNAAGLPLRELGTLRREVEAYPDEAPIWAQPERLPNSGGTPR